MAILFIKFFKIYHLVQFQLKHYFINWFEIINGCMQFLINTKKQKFESQKKSKIEKFLRCFEHISKLAKYAKV